MFRSFTIILIWVCTQAEAQSGLTIDTLWIHRAAPNDEDMDSCFPILKSPSAPAVARTVNTVLQMQTLGYILTPEKKTTLLNQPANPFDRTNFSFAFKRMTDRLFYIDILTWHFNNTMSMNGWNQTGRYYFDATNGQPVFMHEVFFNSKTIEAQIATIGSGLKEDMIKVMKKYNTDFREQDLAGLDKDCQCDCSGKVKNAFRDNNVRLAYNESTKTFGISMDDCDWMNPRAHDVYEMFLGKDKTDPWLTPYGRYLIYGGTPVANDTFFKMWTGTIEKIPITFFLWADGGGAKEGHGLEIYDRHGISIPLHIQVTPDNSLEFQELAGDGKVLATITAKLQGPNLVGKWMKADGSKTLTFTASPTK